ncbi:hypothetical protein YC2023_061359 [Brassica napus]
MIQMKMVGSSSSGSILLLSKLCTNLDNPSLVKYLYPGYLGSLSQWFMLLNFGKSGILWGELQEIQTTLFLDHRNWIIGGDFNQITHHHEHSSPSVDQLTSAMIELQDHFLNLGVNDLRFQGSHHTWTNKCPAAPTTKKMDRALVSGHWIEAFPGRVASFLPYEFSDHTPYLIDLSCPLPSVGTRPFKYFNFLPNHPSFLTAVENAWVLSGSTTLDLHMLGFKLKSIKRELKTLNRERFSDIEKSFGN